PHRNAILRRYFCASDAIKRRTGIGNLDEAGDADATMDVLRSQGGLLDAQGYASSAIRLRRRISIGSIPTFMAARSTRPSVTEQAIGWPTARYWHITFLFWNTTRARAR